MSYTYGRKTIALIQLVAELKKAGRTPTAEESRLIDSWYGWGPVADAFAPKDDPTWKELGVQITLLLGELCGVRGVNEARKAIITSYFTDSLLTQAVWSLVKGLGFSGGRVLEAGCGTGSFLTTAPADLALQAVGVERDPFSALVAQMRLPDAEIINDLLQKVAFPRQSFDLVIGNVPFADIAIYDDEERDTFSLHNYFLLRGLRALRPGGILAAISSRYSLDAQARDQRQLLERYGSFLGALRLPSGAHRIAGTQVITDLLLFQRHAPGSSASSKPWLGLSTDVVEGLLLNQHFVEYPQHILGVPESGRGMYGNDELVIKRPDNLPEVLHQAVQDFLADAVHEGIAYVARPNLTLIDEALVPRRDDGFLEGSFYWHQGQLVQVVEGKLKKVERYRAALTGLVQIRDAALKLFEAEQDLECPDADLKPLRQALNRAYDAYVRQHGAILQSKLTHGQDEDGEKTIIRRLPGQIAAFRNDRHFATVLGLVSYNDKKQKEEKADIFFRRIHRKPETRTHAADASEALAICLDECGRLDLTIMGRLLSIEPSAVPPLLGEMAYEDPQRREWVATDEYLSGNVRVKLAQARLAVEQHGSRYQRNVEALEPVMPTDLAPEEIHASMGVSWISTGDIATFCRDLVGISPAVTYEAASSVWTIKAMAGTQYGAAATSTWGTVRMSALRLIEAGLNKRTPYVWDELADGTRVKNQDESVAAQAKLLEVQERFSTWVWEEPERAARLAARYNELFRSEVVRSYNGAFLTFPDMSTAWTTKMYLWQRNFIARMIASRSGLCGHPVGAGKTMTMIATAMTLRRLGFITRAGIVVPNHLLEQIASEAKRLYPQARILMISRADLTKEKKAIFAARIAAGDYDLVVLTHSSLYALGMHPETERTFIEEKITLYRQALLDQLGADESSLNKRTAKSLEKKIVRLEERQQHLLKKDATGVMFEHLGLSMVLIDEAHEYKNLGLPSNVEGFQVEPSRRATDLEMKLRWLERQSTGPFAAFFTATPLSNNMVEAYVLGWYLDQQRLLNYGLNSVDAFVSNFIDITTEVEVSPDGSSFRMKSRPRSFFNISDFLEMFAQFADIQTSDILDDKRPVRQDTTVAVDASPEMLEFVASLVTRAEELRSGGRAFHGDKEDNMLRIVHEGRELAVSPRQVGILTGPSPKVEAVAAKMIEVYQRWQKNVVKLPGEFNSLQIGFCDLGTPSREKGDQVYGELKRALVAGGIPEYGIRYIHEANSDAAKDELFTQCRNGEVAILLGSTAKLGTGTNVQYRCAAIHIIAPPWRPADVEQCIGRGHRPGNRFSGVQIFRYAVKRTFDAYMWQTLERKAHFMQQLMSGKVTGREINAQSELELSFAEVKAAATGDVLVLEQAATDMEVARLQRLAKTFFSARERDKKEASKARNDARSSREYAKFYQCFNDKVQQCKRPGFKTSNGHYLDDLQDIGSRITQQIFDFVMRGARGWQLIGHWSDQDLFLAVGGDITTLKVGIAVGTSSDERMRVQINPIWTGDGQQWRIAKAIQEFFVKASTGCERLIGEAEAEEREAEQFEEEARKPFPHEMTLKKLMGRKMALDHYTTAVAGNKNAADIEVLRAEVLAGAEKDYSLDLEKSTTPVQTVAIVLRPEVEAVEELEEQQPEEPAEQPSVEVEPVAVVPVEPVAVVPVEPVAVVPVEPVAVVQTQQASTPVVRQLRLVPDAEQAKPVEQKQTMRITRPGQLRLVLDAEQAASAEQTTPAQNVRPLVIASVVEPIDLATLTAVSLFGELLPVASTAKVPTRQRGVRRKKAAARPEKQLCLPELEEQLCLPGLEIRVAPTKVPAAPVKEREPLHSAASEGTPLRVVLQFGQMPPSFIKRRKSSAPLKRKAG